MAYADIEKILKLIADIVSFAANGLTVVASSLAVYLYFSKRKEIASAFRLFMNFSYQTTLAELRWKLDKLNEYRVTDPSHIDEIKSLIHDVAGQIRGNRKLNEADPDLVKLLEKFADGNMTEPKKRSVISLVREKIKNIGIDNFEDIMGN